VALPLRQQNPTSLNLFSPVGILGRDHIVAALGSLIATPGLRSATWRFILTRCVHYQVHLSLGIQYFRPVAKKLQWKTAKGRVVGSLPCPRPIGAQTSEDAPKLAPSSFPEKLQLPCFQFQRSTIRRHGKQQREEIQGLTKNAEEG
jgi:hypothetical protein